MRAAGKLEPGPPDIGEPHEVNGVVSDGDCCLVRSGVRADELDVDPSGRNAILALLSLRCSARTGTPRWAARQHPVQLVQEGLLVVL